MNASDGLFDGDLLVSFEKNASEPRRPYRVRVWVWRTNSRKQTGWFESTDTLREYSEYGGFKAARRFRTESGALRYFATVKGEQARRRAVEQIDDARESGWVEIA